MKKKVLVIIFLIATLLICVVSLLVIKPRFLKEFKDSLVNTYNLVTVKASSEYRALENADHSKKYFKNEKNIKIPILLYHQISIEKSARESYYLCTTAEQFEKQISGLKDLGYTFITYEDLIKYNNNELALPEYVVLLSFDDGYIDNYENAFPVIKKLNIPINIFVVDTFVGHPGYFSWEQAREMEASGLVHIYSHGAVHIPYGDEPAEVVGESISSAHAHLEEELRSPCF
ncbi:MAG: polysaccharide deacetylase family protein [Bacilli bacterium]|nr:polysaccharide deacetylase family protein [Bacilli bacterium]